MALQELGKPPVTRSASSAVGSSARPGAWWWPEAVVVLGLMVLALALRWRTLWTAYWGDEAIAIGIARHSLGAMPHYLVNDGAPPLYYVALHFWMELFGQSPPATHALSLVAAVACVPAAWWCGQRLWGRTAGRIAAALVATCSYLDYYSTETRMYSWLVLVSLLAVTFFTLACRGEGKRYWAGAAVCVSLALYLQYYALYLLAATVVVGLVVAWRHRHRALAVGTVAYAAGCCLAFAPWVPQFVYQLRHTGAPWAPHPLVLDLFADPANALASAGWAGVGVAAIFAVTGRRRAARRSEQPVPSLGVALAVPAVMLVMAWSVAQVVNSWSPRYLGIIVVPALLPLAGALAHAPWGRFGAVVAVLALVGTAVPLLVDQEVTVLTSKSDAAYLMAELHGQLHPGALVISAEVTDAPVFALYLGPSRYRWATPLGPLADPLVVNWSNLMRRLGSSTPAAHLEPLLARVPLGGQVLVVSPSEWAGNGTADAYQAAAEAQALTTDALVAQDHDFRLVRALEAPRYSNPLYPMEATLYVRVKVPGR